MVITDLYTPGQDPGYVSVTQLSYMFDRDVPCGCAPFAAMKSEDDAMWDAPAFETKGLDLLFEVQKGSSLILQAARTVFCQYSVTLCSSLILCSSFCSLERCSA